MLPSAVALSCWLAGTGLQDAQIAERLGVAPRMSTRWRGRFLALDVGGLLIDAQRPGRKPTILAEKIVGLYLNPLEHALVLSGEEKCQIQALDRTQPGLPMSKGRAQTMTHNETRTLFAAHNTATGKVYGLCLERYRHQELLKFPRLID